MPYAEAMSSTETSSAPRAMDGTGSSSEVTPMRWATSMTLSRPTIIAEADEGAVDRDAVIWATVRMPPLAELTCSPSGPPKRSLEKTQGLVPSMMSSGRAPASSAATSTKVLNDEPGWRWPCVARLNLYASKPGPPTMASTAPVRGSMVAVAAVKRPWVSGSWSATARFEIS